MQEHLNLVELTGARPQLNPLMGMKHVIATWRKHPASASLDCGITTW